MFNIKNINTIFWGGEITQHKKTGYLSIGIFILYLLFCIAIHILLPDSTSVKRGLRLPISAGFLFAMGAYVWKLNKKFFLLSFFVALLYALTVIIAAITVPVSGKDITSAFSVGIMLFSAFSMIPILLKTPLLPKLGRIILYFIYVIAYLCIVTIPLVAMGYLIISQGHPVTPDIILTLFQTNIDESLAYVKSQPLWVWLFSLVFIISSLLLVGRWLKRWPCYAPIYVTKKAFCLLLVFTVAASIFSIKQGIVKKAYYPIVAVQEAHNGLKEYKAYGEAKKKRMMRLQALSGLHIDEKDKGIYILVIGESETRDHMHAYGYSRETTPWLDSMVSKSGTILFQHAYSNHTHTVPALTYALSEKNQYNTMRLEDAYSIIEIAKAAGYDTWWISNQLKYGAYDTPIAEMASTVDHEVWINTHAGKLVKTSYYDEELVNRLPHISDNTPAFIVVHLMGCHGNYADRYPHEYARFTGKNDEVSSYDNAVAYTDYVLQQIYEKVKTYPNFKGLIFFSDHGEAVEENKRHESTKFEPVMSRIPFVFIASPAYIQSEPEKYARIQSHISSYWTNDLAFNFLVDVLGIEGYDTMEWNRDIASDSYDMTKGLARTLHGKQKIE